MSDVQEKKVSHAASLVTAMSLGVLAATALWAVSSPRESQVVEEHAQYTVPAAVAKMINDNSVALGKLVAERATVKELTNVAKGLENGNLRLNSKADKDEVERSIRQVDQMTGLAKKADTFIWLRGDHNADPRKIGLVDYGGRDNFNLEMWVFMPANQRFGGWRNLFHVGNADNQRSPAVWVIPNQRRLHVRQASTLNNNWNGGFDTSRHLRNNNQHTLVVCKGYRTEVRCDMDNIYAGRDPQAPRYLAGQQTVWARSPWHHAGHGLRIKEVKFTVRGQY